MIKTLATKYPGKYPARMGQPWADDETQKLLQAVKRSESHDQMAKTHERTIGSIRAKLSMLAYEYYQEEVPIEKIQIYTGLDKEVIVDSIARRTWQDENKKKKNEAKLEIYDSPLVEFNEKKNTQLTEIIDLLKEMKGMMAEMIRLQKDI
jgi:hypothetical protein